MKPLWKNGKLVVELHKPELILLRRAKDLGRQLNAMHQETGAPLVDAINVILGEKGEEDTV